MFLGPIASLSELHPDNGTLLVFLDDTGKPDLDPIYQPIFGFGGVVASWGEYVRAVQAPWREMRIKIGLGDDQPFHATSLPHGDIPTVQEFFVRNRFGRIGAVMTDKTDWPKLVKAATEWMDFVMRRRIEDIARWSSFTNLSVVIEDSQTARADIERLFGAWRMNENGTDIPVKVATMTKKPCEPGLEAADYVANRAAKEGRHRLGRQPGFHPETPAIFHLSDRRLTSFMYVESIKPEKSQSMPIPSPCE